MTGNPARSPFRHVPHPSSDIANRLAAARAGDQAQFDQLTNPYRGELLSHCYRILGSLEEAEELVQETLLRAWRRLDSFEGRAPFRAWLYKIATNACLDTLARRPKRALPQMLRAASGPDDPVLPPILEPIWLEPFPDELLAPAESNPEARYEARESVTLAFLAALQSLPPRQRSVLILCDVLGWSAGEAANVFETTVPAINSLLHRARAKLKRTYSPIGYEQIRLAEADERTQLLLKRYQRAWESADIDGFVMLLKEDAAFAMPPFPLWYQGRPAIRDFAAANPLAGEAAGRWRLYPIRVNGLPGFALYCRTEASGDYRAYAIQALRCQDGRLAEVITFGYPQFFAYFGLPGEHSL
jgi:RNA polymerase sigma-70 factor (ECF subfamily)